MGAYNALLERYIQDLSSGVLQAPSNLIGKSKIQIYSHLTTVDQGGQKNRNGKTTAILFHISFLLVIVGIS